MAHHESALKRIKQNRMRKIYNRANKKLLKLSIKNVREAKTYTEGMEMLQKVYSVIDRVTARGVMHKNTAANRKSSLSEHVKRLKSA